MLIIFFFWNLPKSSTAVMIASYIYVLAMYINIYRQLILLSTVYTHAYMCTLANYLCTVSYRASPSFFMRRRKRCLSNIFFILHRHDKVIQSNQNHIVHIQEIYYIIARHDYLHKLMHLFGLHVISVHI